MKKNLLLSILMVLVLPVFAFASEADLKIPEFSAAQIQYLYIGFAVCVLGLLFALMQFIKVKKLPADKSMLDVSQIIFETCKTYLIQQGKFLLKNLWTVFPMMDGV